MSNRNAPMSSNSIVLTTACELAEAIRSRTVSCVEVMESYLDRIDRVNPEINAIVSLRPRDVLLHEARERDRELANAGPRGWMHGFPAAVKDLDPVKGMTWTSGSPIFRNRIAEADSIQVERMRAAGAVFIGKTNTSEFGLGSHAFNPVFGTTRNPYDSSKCAGGSSGGAAAALATRMLPVADGSDHAGSLRNPAAFNNVFGLRPSFGRIPEAGPDLFSATLGVVGPMARTVEDLAMLLSVQAGPDPRAPLSINESATIFSDFAHGMPVQLRNRRIGWLGDLGGHLACEDEVISLCEAGLDVFEQLGVTVEPLKLDFPAEEIWENWLTLRAWIMSVQLGPYYRDPATRALMKPDAIWEVERGLGYSAERVASAITFRTAWFRTMNTWHASYDAVALPSAQVFAFDAGQIWPTRIGGRTMDTYHRWMETVIPGTMSGCPVISVPVGFNRAGLPMGMQLIGRMNDELSCLALARLYDKAMMWTRRCVPPGLDLPAAPSAR